eukprot:2027749-Prymnesium_polylepis.1
MICLVQVGARIAQELDALEATHRGNHQRRPQVLVGQVDRRASVEQLLYALGEPLSGRTGERALAAPAGQVHVRPTRQQEGDNRPLRHVRRHREQRARAQSPVLVHSLWLAQQRHEFATGVDRRDRRSRRAGDSFRSYHCFSEDDSGSNHGNSRFSASNQCP